MDLMFLADPQLTEGKIKVDVAACKRNLLIFLTLLQQMPGSTFLRIGILQSSSRVLPVRSQLHVHISPLLGPESTAVALTATPCVS